jgi:hypothetical protein
VGHVQEEGRERERDEKKWAAGMKRKGNGEDKKKGFSICNSRRLRDIQRGFGTNLLRT